ncbi:MAG: hypothetical protein ABIS50_26675 [Luteolibacter sp.]|uniref:Ig-like domain-containing protein n=1 Tax=Luteolibacter sp. TaxID=1962973 RepID=UPI003266E24F
MITIPSSPIARKSASGGFLPLARLMLAACALLVSTGTARALQTGIQNELSAAEYQALLDLYNSAGGKGWLNDQGWPNPAKSWQGVTIQGVERDGNGDVVTKGTVSALLLPRSLLVGTLPASLGNLTHLQNFDLSSNQLSGPIPATFGGMTELLVCNLSGNKLSGRIPTSLGNLTKLGSLDLGDNKLTGPIPAELGNLSKLKILSLFNNALTGPIPTALGGLTLIESIDFGINFLNGAIPANFLKLKHLTSMELLGNDFDDRNPNTPFMKSRQALADKGVAVPYLPQRHRIIALTGDLAFGSRKVNTRTSLKLTISNTGDFAMKVTRLKLPVGFKGNFTGTIQPGKKKAVTITFAPTAKKLYAGQLTVVSDANYGTPTARISGTGN